MKRILWVVLMGTSFLFPIEAEAQRGRVRNAPTSGQIAPASARLSSCRAPSGGRPYVCRNDVHTNVVYRYSGNGRNRVRRAWVVAKWGRIHIYPVRYRSRSREIGQRQLRDMLGTATVRRLRDVGRRAGLRGPVRGRWTESRRSGAVLTLTMNRHEVARFLDYDRDGLVDEVLLHNVRRW